MGGGTGTGIPKIYIAEAHTERLNHWEKFLFAIDAFDLQVGDPVLVDLLMGKVGHLGTYHRLADHKIRKIKAIETNDEYRTVTIKVRGYGFLNRKFRVLREARILVDATDTKGHLTR